jgi:uncharacterized membrane protein
LLPGLLQSQAIPEVFKGLLQALAGASQLHESEAFSLKLRGERDHALALLRSPVFDVPRERVKSSEKNVFIEDHPI